MNVSLRTIEDATTIKDIDASQYIKRAWRLIEGKRRLVELNVQSNGYPEGFDAHYESLKQTIQNDGYAVGAYDKDHLIGFATVNRNVFGLTAKYVLLDQLFISLPYRNRGIGKVLFSCCVDQAKAWKADKIYICAGSAEDTVAFYEKLGCIEATEINQNLYEKDPRDIQMEFPLKGR